MMCTAVLCSMLGAPLDYYQAPVSVFLVLYQSPASFVLLCFFILL